MTTRHPLAIVTMAFNEEDLLPLWLRHHAHQVGREHCYVVDHGSTDAGPHLLPGANLLRLPRSPLDEAQRAGFVSDFAASLLHWYECVAYVDADELLVADPARHTNLAAYCAATTHEVATALGLNVLHRLGAEPELNRAGLVSRQRSWLTPASSLCKPSLIRRPVRWAPGFHSADAAPVFDDLFLFHLAFADYDLARRRHRKRQAHARVSTLENPHHQVDQAELDRWFQGWATQEEVPGAELDPACPVRTAFQDRILASTAGREHDRYRTDISLTEPRSWRLPARFAGSF